MTSTCLGRTRFDAASLMREHPPRFKLAHKRLVYERAMATGAPRGSIAYSRWGEPPLPTLLSDVAPRVDLRDDVFGYEPEADGVVPWYLNFAHTILFVAYGGPLLAQDELQVLEHPALGSVREALVLNTDAGLRPVTREDGHATPVLITGVERRCALATDVDLEAGHPLGLYGNRSRGRAPSIVLRSLRVLDPPTRSNLGALEAPPGGAGAVHAQRHRSRDAHRARGLRGGARGVADNGARRGRGAPHRPLGHGRVRWRPRAHGHGATARGPHGRHRARGVSHGLGRGRSPDARSHRARRRPHLSHTRCAPDRRRPPSTRWASVWGSSDGN